MPTNDVAECSESSVPELGDQGYAIDLDAGEEETDNDFGNQTENATKSGIKFHDRNSDGIQNGTDPGLANWVINAYADDEPANGDLDQAEYDDGPEASDTTGGGGGYSLTLPAGDYIVCEELQRRLGPDRPDRRPGRVRHRHRRPEPGPAGLCDHA